MGHNSYNSSYRIALYQLPDEYQNLLKKTFDDQQQYSKHTYDLKVLNKLSDVQSSDLISQPDVLLIDEVSEITPELQEYSRKNLIQIIRVHGSMFTNNYPQDFSLSLSTDIIETKKLTSSYSEFVTEIDQSVHFIKLSAQMANFEKLRYISQKVMNLESSQVVNMSDKDQLINTLLRLNHFISLKDDYTKMHCDHVSDYATLLAQEIGLSEEEIRFIQIGGELHDIGKVGIPNAILQKRDKLTDEEFEIMKSHTVLGDSLLPNEGFDQIKEMIRFHHERMDGRGYPDKLKGEEIPLAARILAVADTFDAMTTQRSYNRKKTLQEAFNELYKAAKVETNVHGQVSQQLDPVLVEKFTNAIKKNPYLMDYFSKQDQEILKERQRNSLNVSESNLGRMK